MANSKSNTSSVLFYNCIILSCNCCSLVDISLYSSSARLTVLAIFLTAVFTTVVCAFTICKILANVSPVCLIASLVFFAHLS